MPGVGLQLPAPLSSLSALALKFLIGTFPVPPFLLPIYQAAGIDYGVPWEVLASINEVETDYGRDLATSSAGAVGWMQFLPSTWERYGINADAGAGANPYDPIDAIFAAARYLHAAGAEANLSGAIFAYNHAGWYVNSVELRANVLQLLPRGLIDGLTGLMQASFPVAGHLRRYATMTPTPVAMAGQPAVALGGPAGAPVIAAADGRVVAIGEDAQRGRYVTIEDSYGDRFTYARLGSVESVYPVLTPRVESATRLAGELGLRPPARGTRMPAATSSTTTPPARAGAGAGGGRGRAGGAAAPTPTSGPSSAATAKERLFAHPSRTASYVSGGELQLQSSLRSYAAASDLQVGGSGPSDYFSESAQLKPGEFTLAPMGLGATVVAGTILGRIAPAAQSASHVVLQIRPAGARAPVEPSPIVAGWELLGRLTAGRPALAGAGQSGAFGSRNPSLGQLLLSSKRDLEQAVLTDPRLTISGCDRQAVQAGLVDWRVLAAIEYLSYSGLAPTISGLVCGQPGIPSQAGMRVEISSLDGIPVAGNEQDGGVVDLAIRALLALQGSLRPSRIVSLRSYPWQANTIALPDHAATLEVDFSTPGSAASASGALDTAQWERLIQRLTQLGAPATGSGAASPAAPASPPTVTTPTVTTPTVTTPTVTTPTVTTPTVTTPLTTPTITTPKATATVTAPTVPTRAPAKHVAKRGKAARSAQSSLTPTPIGLTAPSPPLTGSTNNFTVTVPASTTITEVVFEYAVAGTPFPGTPFACAPATVPGCTGGQSGTVYTGNLDTTLLAPGLYDFQAVAITAGPPLYSMVVHDLAVTTGATYVALTNPGSNLSGTVNLTATAQAGGNTPDQGITFWECPTTGSCPAAIQTSNGTPAGNWTSLATVQPQPFNGAGSATYQLCTSAQAPSCTGGLSDGTYDFAVTAQDAAGDLFQGGAVSNVLVDNTPPTVTLQPPGPLSGPTATLMTASASDSGSLLDAVKFEVAPAGTNNWTGIGTADSPPYSVSFDSRQFSDGSYDVQAVAVDNAGNQATSTVSGVSIANPGAQKFGGLTITNYVAPAYNITLLGELPGSQHDTWAIGQTNAPPPASLQQKYTNPVYPAYNNQGNGQLVLLEYTDASGWQIADVLLDKNGNPYPLPAAGTTLQVTGQMTPSGEAWVIVKINVHGISQFYVFHRPPGGEFELDPTATANLTPVLKGNLTLRLAQGPSNGPGPPPVYGVLVSSQAPTQTQTGVQSPNGPVTISTQLAFGDLVPGTEWTVAGSPTSGPLPAGYVAPSGVTRIALDAADVTDTGTIWAALQQSPGGPMLLANFGQNGWSFLPPTGLDALDLTGPLAPGSQQFPPGSQAGFPGVVPGSALRADGADVWLSAAGAKGQPIFARYDVAGGRVVDASCASIAGLDSPGCPRQWLPPNEPAAVPNAIFTAPDGSIIAADALVGSPGASFIDVYYDGAWTAIAAPGFANTGPGGSVFADPTDGWLAGPSGGSVLGRVSAAPPTSPLAVWPEANRNPLLSAALPPGQSTTDTAGALAVGLNGTAMHYDPSAGWQVDATPALTHHIALTGVGFASPSSAFAVGQEGIILRWNGASWSADPQSVSLTTATLNAVAFGTNGQGWAVGAHGTILHYDGTSWSLEQIDSPDAGTDVTSVAVAGPYVYAIASGNLIERTPAGTWQPFPSSSLPSPLPPVGSLQLVSAVPDGGVAVAGKSLLMTTDSPSTPFAYAPQSFNGIPVALAAFRDPSGALRAFLSVAPTITTQAGPTNNVGGFPAGDGDLLLLNGSGWEDLSRDLPPSSALNAPGDGVVQPDPVLAVAASPDGTHAWAVGGYAGTHAADGVGTDQLLAGRPAGWFTSAVWRYDAGGSAGSAATAQAPASLTATPSTISFAYLSSALCKITCAQVQSAQPDVNLSSAATQIAAFAQQPGGPAFAMLGGNVHGSMAGSATDPLDIANLPRLLSPLSAVPTYAAYGPEDATAGGGATGALPWADVFRGSPAPFGAGAAPASITPRGSGDATGPVNKYYALDVRRNGGTLRVIVLDNSAGSLEASATGQTAWLTNQLAQAQAAALPTVVFAAEPLNSNDVGAATDGDAVAAQLAAAGVLGVFTTSGGSLGAWQTQQDRVAQVPVNAAPGAPQIPEYEGATMTYQQPSNNGVLWYDVSVDTTTDQLSVNAIPVISSLTLAPLDGLTVNRSSTLSFQAIGRRPPGTIATTPDDSSFPGYPQYVGIPASTCSGCIGPSYSFRSSNPVVGHFVVASGPGSPYPKLTAAGKTTASSTSGLFCGFNGGTTTVSVTSGLLTSSLPVTVNPSASFGPPCGTVAGGSSTITINEKGQTIYESAQAGQSGPTPPPTTNPLTTNILPRILLPPPPLPLPVLRPTPHVPTTVITPVQQITQIVPGPPPGTLAVPPTLVPLIPPALTPVPPGGATVSAQAAARREEKARRHAQQSAYVIRPMGTSGSDWFFPAAGVVSVLAVLLLGAGARPGPRRRYAWADSRRSGADSSSQRRR